MAPAWAVSSLFSIGAYFPDSFCHIDGRPRGGLQLLWSVTKSAD